MPWVLETTDEQPKIYCGPDTGWLETTPPIPPTPEEQAMKFPDQKTADEYAKKHGMKAASKEVA